MRDQTQKCNTGYDSRQINLKILSKFQNVKYYTIDKRNKR